MGLNVFVCIGDKLALVEEYRIKRSDLGAKITSAKR